MRKPHSYNAAYSNNIAALTSSAFDTRMNAAYYGTAFILSSLLSFFFLDSFSYISSMVLFLVSGNAIIVQKQARKETVAKNKKVQCMLISSHSLVNHFICTKLLSFAQMFANDDTVPRSCKINLIVAITVSSWKVAQIIYSSCITVAAKTIYSS